MSVPGFVEFVKDDSGYPRLVAVSQIVSVTSMRGTGGAIVSLNGGGTISIRESYEQACVMIKCALSPEPRS